MMFTLTNHKSYDASELIWSCDIPGVEGMPYTCKSIVPFEIGCPTLLWKSSTTAAAAPHDNPCQNIMLDMLMQSVTPRVIMTMLWRSIPMGKNIMVCSVGRSGGDLAWKDGWCLVAGRKWKVAPSPSRTHVRIASRRSVCLRSLRATLDNILHMYP